MDHRVDEPVLVDVTPLLLRPEPNTIGTELVSLLMGLVKIGRAHV